MAKSVESGCSPRCCHLAGLVDTLLPPGYRLGYVGGSGYYRLDRYAADRLLDVRSGAPATARHQFARSHRKAFTIVIIAAVVITAALISPFVLLAETLPRGLASATGIVAYFYLIHRARGDAVHPLAKEAAVALLFALGVILPLPFGTRLFAPWVASVVLVWLNTNAIDSWESGCRPSGTVALGSLLAAVVCSVISRSGEYGGALAASSMLTFGLHGLRHHFSRQALRVGADIVLVLPAWVILLR